MAVTQLTWPANGTSRWPDNAPFAFSIVDDTDKTTLRNGPLVYDLLTDLGFKITKTVWPLAPSQPPRTGGTSCADEDYLSWVQSLQRAGHEIGYHNASDHPSTRARTIEALDSFHSMFGHDPLIGADHSANIEALYAGPRRVSGLHSMAYRVASRFLWDQPLPLEGEQADSPYYWGDVCLDRIRYWRSFTFPQTNTLDAWPLVPYHDPTRPLVRWWYTASDAPHLDPFLKLVSPDRLDELEAANGACILYTHFGTNFVQDGELHPAFAEAMRVVASRGAWLAPASQILDHLRNTQGEHTLTSIQRAQLERRWIRGQIKARSSHRWQTRRDRV